MPFTDDNMLYNYDKHRYILTEEFCSNELNVNIADVLNSAGTADKANNAEKFLDRVSKIIYNYIYRINAFHNETERRLALDAALRPSIQEAMGEQVLWMLNNGDLSAVAQVSIQGGTIIESKRGREHEIAPIAMDILITNKIVNARVPRFLKDIIPTYESEGY